MTVSEVYTHTRGLCFEDTLESDERFYDALNRALLQASLLRPKIIKYPLYHNPPENLVTEASFAPVCKISELIYYASAPARSYYFEADGNGYAYLEYESLDGEWEIAAEVMLSSGGEFRSYRGFVLVDGKPTEKRVRLRFSGDYLYSVKSVAMYSVLYSGEEKDIPAYRRYVPYDFSVLCADFLAFERFPLYSEGGKNITAAMYDIVGETTLLLPYEAGGMYCVCYRAKPKRVSTNDKPINSTETLDADEEICSLLPLLVASYLWFEDEPSRAQYYMELYRERAAELTAAKRTVKPAVYLDTNGW